MNKGLMLAAGILAAVVVGTAAVAPTVAAQRPATSVVDANLANFDDLDFRVFTNQKWDELKKSHAPCIVVHWPDGHSTTGIEKHIEDLKAMFVYAPDTRIKEHPVRIGSGEWTSVIGVMEGTFTAPMPVGPGKTIAPTGKTFRLSMNTVGRWNARGTMDEEYLFWDNATYMQQLGLGQ
jgi:hypothetical protein